MTCYATWLSNVTGRYRKAVCRTKAVAGTRYCTAHRGWETR